MKKSLKIALLFLTTFTFITCGGGSSGGGSAGGGTPNPTKIRISEATGDEGGMITFKVIATPPITKQITFKYEATVDSKETNPAKISDLSGKLTGTSTIDANNTTATISIATVNDTLREKAETFMVILSDLSPNEVTFGDNVAIGTITENDATGIVIISVADAKASEASSSIKFKVTSAFPAPALGFSFDYEATIDSPFKSNSSASTDDFTAIKNTATIPTDSTNAIISITVAIDDTIEPDETFRLLLTNLSSNATIDSAKNSAMGTILNDDLGEISDATAIIGDTAITLNWTNPKSNIFSGAVIAYQESSSTAPAKCSDGMTQLVNNAQATSDTITGLTNGTAYSVRICARSISGSLSDGDDTLTNLRPLPAVDKDKDGLIDIADATGLYNIRYNLAGTSLKTSSSTSIDGNTTGNTTGCPNGICRGYELTANIDLSSFNDGTWNPIGSSSNRFTAIFDGNNRTISGLDISSDSDYVGLFSAMEDATIRNLKLTNIRITGAGNVGALVGQATGTTLSNIELIGDNLQSSSDAEIKGNGASVGGLVGDFRSGTITDSTSSLTVRGGATEDADNVGGLVGQLQGGSIKNSNSSGSVSTSGGADDVGGLVGLLAGGSIQNSNSSGSVSASSGIPSSNFILNDARRVGGLVGGNSGTVSNSWASGDVSITGQFSSTYGGLVGQNNTGSTINHSWASGEVTGSNVVGGGLVGWNYGHISNSWASGEIRGASSIGGLAGRNNGNISNSWANGNASNITPTDSDYGGLVGRNNGNISNSWASGNLTGNGSHTNYYGGLVGNNRGNISNSWASGEVIGGNNNIGGLVGNNFSAGRISGRNYRLSNGDNSIGTKLADATALANLSGANGDTATADSNWHAGFNNDPFTMFCNTNGDGTIDTNEKVASNSVWVMAPAANNVTTDTNAANLSANYYQIPAIRCIGNTPAERKANIDLQRSKFPTN